jgi:hypothetical protein
MRPQSCLLLSRSKTIDYLISVNHGAYSWMYFDNPFERKSPVYNDTCILRLSFILVSKEQLCSRCRPSDIVACIIPCNADISRNSYDHGSLSSRECACFQSRRHWSIAFKKTVGEQFIPLTSLASTSGRPFQTGYGTSSNFFISASSTEQTVIK